MRTLFAGQLDRVFANEFAISVGPEPDDHWDLESVEEQRSSDSRLFHLAGTLAALSDEIVALPYVRYIKGVVHYGDSFEPYEASTEPTAHTSRLEAIMDFDQVANDALELAKVCALMGELAATSENVLDEVDTDEGWIGHYHALRHLHGEHGVPLAYLAGLLMQAHHASKIGAVFVIAECDRLILADLGAIIVRKRWPRPFAIPDLRYLAEPYDKGSCGPLLNLHPTDLAGVDALKSDPGIRAYAEAICGIVHNMEARNVGSALEKANRSFSLGGALLPNDRAEFTLIAANVRMFSNSGTVNPGKGSAWDDWAQRRFPTPMLRTIILI